MGFAWFGFGVVLVVDVVLWVWGFGVCVDYWFVGLICWLGLAV